LLAIFTSRRCLASLNAVSPDGKLSEDIVDAAAPVLIAIGRDGDRPGPHDAAARTGAAVLAVDRGDVRRLCDADPSRWTNPDAPGIAIEMLSRGTTGKPKRIPLPLRGRISAYAVSTRRRTSLVEAMRQPIAVLR
jgi:non-ribosomal peptide synthetase component F